MLQLWDSSDESDEGDTERLPRTFRERINTEFRTEYEFNERFRMTSVKMEELVLLLGQFLDHSTERSHALSVKLQICLGLHWLGSGGQYHTVSDMHGVSKASVCRAVHALVNAVEGNIFNDIVKWPTDILQVISKFHRLAAMPMVVGCIDGTLIDIDAPHLNEAHYVDRHGNHSINCMVVCGPDCQFYYVSARWPGSVHDSRVLRNSTLHESFEGGWRPINGGVILGDSGYPLRDWLLTPSAQNLTDPATARYNRAHKSTRRVVENSFGILRENFPCINYLRVNPEFSCKIFKCCTALCNIIRTTEDEENVVREIEDNNDDEDNDYDNDDSAAPSTSGVSRLNDMLNHFR